MQSWTFCQGTFYIVVILLLVVVPLCCSSCCVSVFWKARAVYEQLGSRLASEVWLRPCPPRRATIQPNDGTQPIASVLSSPFSVLFFFFVLIFFFGVALVYQFNLPFFLFVFDSEADKPLYMLLTDVLTLIINQQSKLFSFWYILNYVKKQHNLIEKKKPTKH